MSTILIASQLLAKPLFPSSELTQKPNWFTDLKTFFYKEQQLIVKDEHGTFVLGKDTGCVDGYDIYKDTDFLTCGTSIKKPSDNEKWEKDWFDSEPTAKRIYSILKCYFKLFRAPEKLLNSISDSSSTGLLVDVSGNIYLKIKDKIEMIQAPGLFSIRVSCETDRGRESFVYSEMGEFNPKISSLCINFWDRSMLAYSGKNESWLYFPRFDDDYIMPTLYRNEGIIRFFKASREGLTNDEIVVVDDVLIGYDRTIKVVEVPEGVREVFPRHYEIENSDQYKTEEIILPSTLETLYYNSFYGLPNLRKIIFKNKEYYNKHIIKNIDKWAEYIPEGCELICLSLDNSE